MRLYVIIHPTTKDRATADTRQGADTAARTLRREATAQGCSPRTRCTVAILNEEGQ